MGKGILGLKVSSMMNVHNCFGCALLHLASSRISSSPENATRDTKGPMGPQLCSIYKALDDDFHQIFGAPFF